MTGENINVLNPIKCMCFLSSDGPVMVFELVLDTMGFGGCFRYLLGRSCLWPCMMFANAVTRVTEDKAIMRPFHI